MWVRHSIFGDLMCESPPIPVPAWLKRKCEEQVLREVFGIKNPEGYRIVFNNDKNWKKENK